MSSLLEALAMPLFALVDFALAAPLAAAGTFAATGVTLAATARFFLLS
jgi:hypothetical protein